MIGFTISVAYWCGEEDVHSGDVRTNEDSTQGRSNVLGHDAEIGAGETDGGERGSPPIWFAPGSRQGPIHICGTPARLSERAENRTRSLRPWLL